MGYIFSREEILEGIVPTIDDYWELKKELPAKLRQWCQDGKIVSAILGGSVFLHSNKRLIGSDVDLMVTLNDLKHLFEISSGIDKLSKRRKIRIEFAPLVTMNWLQNGFHSIGWVHYAHLVSDKSVVIGKNVLASDILITHLSLKQDVIHFFDRLAKKFPPMALTFCNKDEKYYMAIENLLRHTMYIVLYMIIYKMGKLPLLDGEILPKNQWVKKYKKLYPRVDTITTENVFRLFFYYREMMSRYHQASDKEAFWAQQYLPFLTEVESQLIGVLGFAYRNRLELNKAC